MLRIPCPKCQRNSYTSNVESFSPCSYCGSLFSGKYGLDKRLETRISQEIPFVLSHQGKNFKATTSDFSNKGVGIKIYGDASLAETGDVLTLTIGDLYIIAKVMWFKKLPDKSLAGLHRVN